MILGNGCDLNEAKYGKRITELDFFKQDLKNLNYEDYCDFIADFINDTKLLFMNCNNIQFKNILNDYNVDENLFDI